MVDRWLRVSSDLHVAIVRELGRAGIAIPFPQQDLHLKSVEPELFRQMRKDDPT